ncbi:DUF4386 domain-containing protein [Frateuria edaphi]|nr:DUF4386 domain-containing protein [Frateuria edaphi]UGB44258.1 DUF4386 domain-containing protein [Frateuria edaphi]
MIGTIDESQRKAAKVVGLAYLLALPPAIFAEFFSRGQLVVLGNAAETAKNIVAHERLFRLGIASNLTVFSVDVVLIAALYIVLKPIHRGIALVAAGWGLVETSVLMAVTLSDFGVLGILGCGDYLHAFDAGQLQALARLSAGAHGDAYGVGLVLAGFEVPPSAGCGSNPVLSRECWLPGAWLRPS